MVAFLYDSLEAAVPALQVGWASIPLNGSAAPPYSFDGERKADRAINHTPSRICCGSAAAAAAAAAQGYPHRLTLNATELQIWRREPRTAALYRNLYRCERNRKPPNLEAGRRDAYPRGARHAATVAARGKTRALPPDPVRQMWGGGAWSRGSRRIWGGRASTTPLPAAERRRPLRQEGGPADASRPGRPDLAAEGARAAPSGRRRRRRPRRERRVPAVEADTRPGGG
jgi:hypothetical protein